MNDAYVFMLNLSIPLLLFDPERSNLRRLSHDRVSSIAKTTTCTPDSGCHRSSCRMWPNVRRGHPEKLPRPASAILYICVFRSCKVLSLRIRHVKPLPCSKSNCTGLQLGTTEKNPCDVGSERNRSGGVQEKSASDGVPKPIHLTWPDLT